MLNIIEYVHVHVCWGMSSLSISQKSLVLLKPNKYQQFKQYIVFIHICNRPHYQHTHSEPKIS